MVFKAIEGFAPIIGAQAKVLILGTMPSETSLRNQQYYGHQRNAFWPIMGELFNAGPELNYLDRQQILIQQGVAVWDVLKTCRRSGSLDADIDMKTIQVNDFCDLFNTHTLIREVFFNGGAAEAVFNKRIKPVLAGQIDYLKLHRLPSTSPANARMNLQQKIISWVCIKQACGATVLPVN